MMKTNWSWAFLLALLMAFTFHYSATLVQNKYTYLYDHYYQRTPFKNLTHLREYRDQIDNRLTLGKSLRKKGIKVESVESGYTDKGYDVSDPDEYQKKIYYVNDDLYIIFDWDEREITALKEKESIRQAIADQYKDMPVDGDIQNIFSAYDLLIRSDENSRHYIIEPTIENTFRFIEDGYSY